MLALHPKPLILEKPATALDTVVSCGSMAIMYAGKPVAKAPSETITPVG